VISVQNKEVVFTGKLAAMTRREAWECVRSAGGQPGRDVTQRTGILVVGMEGWPVLPDGNISRKLRTAEHLQRRHQRLEIISEAELLEAIGMQERRPALAKQFPAERVCQILGIGRDTLARWEQFGLVQPCDGRYDFQDLVAARTIAELVGRGVAPATIAKTLSRLSFVLPVERPLAQLRIVAENPSELLIELGEQRITPTGQLVLDFGDRPAAAPIADLEARRRRMSADEWFDEGLNREEEEHYTEAAEAFRRAVELRPDFADAWYSLGNALTDAGDLEAAEQAYREALRHDAGNSWAWYNLAGVLLDLERLDDAITALECGLDVAPTFADAHYNLALCYEQAGRRREARSHWETYLRLDPHSEWAKVAKQHL
jgi:tetratricopeptide (TPR) repeat protein